jgi:hypothetical protein
METGRLVGFLLVAGGAIALGVIAFQSATESSGPEESIPALSERGAAFRSCKARLRPAPAGFVERERTVQNLGGSVMGESVIYADSGGGRTLELHAGYDALDAAEDLDFEERGSQRVRGHQVNLLRARGLPSIRAAHWLDATHASPCDSLTVISTNLSEPELLEGVAAVRSSSR